MTISHYCFSQFLIKHRSRRKQYPFDLQFCFFQQPRGCRQCLLLVVLLQSAISDKFNLPGKLQEAVSCQSVNLISTSEEEGKTVTMDKANKHWNLNGNTCYQRITLKNNNAAQNLSQSTVHCLVCNGSPGTFADGPLKAVGKLHHAHSILLFLPREWAASFFLKFAYTAHNHCQSHRFLLNKNNFYFRSSVNILEKTDSFCLPFGKSQFSHLTFHKYAKCDAVQ